MKSFSDKRRLKKETATYKKALNSGVGGIFIKLKCLMPLCPCYTKF